MCWSMCAESVYSVIIVWKTALHFFIQEKIQIQWRSSSHVGQTEKKMLKELSISGFCYAYFPSWDKKKYINATQKKLLISFTLKSYIFMGLALVTHQPKPVLFSHSLTVCTTFILLLLTHLAINQFQLQSFRLQENI